MKIKCQTPKCPPFRFTWAPEMIQRDPQEWTGGTWIMEEDPCWYVSEGQDQIRMFKDGQKDLTNGWIRGSSLSLFSNEL